MAFVYICLFILVFDISLAPYASELIFSIVPVPLGYRSFFVFFSILLLFSWMMVFTKTKVIPNLWKVGKYWIPWILYLAIRTNFSENGIWKYELYLLKVFLPCMILAAMYIANKNLFEKYFMKTFLALNIVMLLYLFAFHRTYNEIGEFDRNIWLSRALGICILYYLIAPKFSKQIFLRVPVILLFVTSMLIIGARGPVLSLTLAITAFYCIKFRKNIGVLAALFTISFVMILFFTYSTNLFQSLKKFSTHGTNQSITQTVQGRTSVYMPTLKIVVSHPCFGAGFANWLDEYKSRFPHESYRFVNHIKATKERFYSYPHNLFLELLSELGTIGLFFFCLLFWPFYRIFNLNVPFNILILLGFLYSMSSSDLTQNAAPMIFNILSITYAILYSSNKKLDKHSMPFETQNT